MDTEKMISFWNAIENANTIAIGGHIRPDGDCVGSCLGLYNYLSEHFSDKKVQVFLGEYDKAFHFLNGLDQVECSLSEEEVEETCAKYPDAFDLFVALDSSNLERLEYETLFHRAKNTVVVDHHITNEEYADTNLVFVSSSAAEAVYDLILFREFSMKDLNMENDDAYEESGVPQTISLNTAECLYLGMIHDTGVFKHSNTTKHTMEAAGALVEIGVDTSKLIDDTFYRKTYIQNLLLGQTLLESALTKDGKIISSVVTQDTFKRYGAGKTDLEGIVDQLRVTQGVEVAVFAYETVKGDFKFSLRSNTSVDVSKVCLAFGGGGHVRASGCTMDAPYSEALKKIQEEIYKQL